MWSHGGAGRFGDQQQWAGHWLPAGAFPKLVCVNSAGYSNSLTRLHLYPPSSQDYQDTCVGDVVVKDMHTRKKTMFEKVSEALFISSRYAFFCARLEGKISGTISSFSIP